MIPLSSGTALTPSIVYVLPVPVCPYAKMVPGNKDKTFDVDRISNRKVIREVLHQRKRKTTNKVHDTLDLPL